MDNLKDDDQLPLTDAPFYKKTIWIMLATFVLSLIIISIFSGPLRCVDGWVSSSIGSSGACSHHGGVEVKPTLIIAILITLFVGYTVNHKKKRLKKMQKETASKIDFTNASDVYSQPLPTDDQGLYNLYKSQGGTMDYANWLVLRNKRR
ncbi:MAG: hypothetical protein JKY27_03515 [Magnetovibrio sp.]|nr:hypothetical protein [Magnetovibrio sp.]